jgi:hypothetical protein
VDTDINGSEWLLTYTCSIEHGGTSLVMSETVQAIHNVDAQVGGSEPTMVRCSFSPWILPC